MSNMSNAANETSGVPFFPLGGDNELPTGRRKVRVIALTSTLVVASAVVLWLGSSQSGLLHTNGIFQEPMSVQHANTQLQNLPHLDQDELFNVHVAPHIATMYRQFLETYGSTAPHLQNAIGTIQPVHELDPEEFHRRLIVFGVAVKEIIKLNLQSASNGPHPHRPVFGINVFCDWTKDEKIRLTNVRESYTSHDPHNVTKVFTHQSQRQNNHQPNHEQVNVLRGKQTGVEPVVLADDKAGSGCVEPKSVQECSPCRDNDQCARGFCCPYQKFCLDTQESGCSWPVVLAWCDKPCWDDDCEGCDCEPSDGTPISSWGKPTCLPANLPAHRNWAEMYPEAFEVRHQGQCGSCWAHSSVQVMRQHWTINKVGEYTNKLSVQFLLDCMPSVNTQPQCGSMGVGGCCGGDVSRALSYIHDIGGLPTQAAYGDYLGGEDSGRFTYHTCQHVVPSLTTLGPIKINVKRDLKDRILAAGSAVIFVFAGAWHSYTGGIMDSDTCGYSTTDHAVIAAGFIKQGSMDAFLVQNSWGANWGVSRKSPYVHVQGDSGFILLAADTNPCNIAEYPAVMPKGISAVGGFVPMPTTVAQTTVPPKPTHTCVDLYPDWIEGHLFTCKWWAESPDYRCHFYRGSDGYVGTNHQKYQGVGPETVCCACGGGKQAQPATADLSCGDFSGDWIDDPTWFTPVHFQQSDCAGEFTVGSSHFTFTVAGDKMTASQNFYDGLTGVLKLGDARDLIQWSNGATWERNHVVRVATTTVPTTSPTTAYATTVRVATTTVPTTPIAAQTCVDFPPKNCWWFAESPDDRCHLWVGPETACCACGGGKQALATTTVPTTAPTTAYATTVQVATTTVDGWRIRATSNSGAWDVERLKFIVNGAELQVGPCKVVDSGSVDVSGYAAENAFKDGPMWGGRPKNGEFYLGLECVTSPVVEVKMKQGCGFFLDHVTIQKKVAGTWVDAGSSDDIACGKEVTLFKTLPPVE